MEHPHWQHERERWRRKRAAARRAGAAGSGHTAESDDEREDEGDRLGQTKRQESGTRGSGAPLRQPACEGETNCERLPAARNLEFKRSRHIERQADTLPVERSLQPLLVGPHQPISGQQPCVCGDRVSLNARHGHAGWSELRDEAEWHDPQQVGRDEHTEVGDEGDGGHGERPTCRPGRGAPANASRLREDSATEPRLRFCSSWPAGCEAVVSCR